MNKEFSPLTFTNTEIVKFFSLSSVTRQRAHSGGRVLAVVPPSPAMRRSSDPQLSPSASNNPPEHPAHTSHSAHSSPAHHPNYQSHSSETAGSYCDLRPCPAGPPKPPAKSYVERLRVEEGRQDGAREEGDGIFSVQVETTSSFRPSRYRKHTNKHINELVSPTIVYLFLKMPSGNRKEIQGLINLYTTCIED